MKPSTNKDEWNGKITKENVIAIICETTRDINPIYLFIKHVFIKYLYGVSKLKSMDIKYFAHSCETMDQEFSNLPILCSQINIQKLILLMKCFMKYWFARHFKYRLPKLFDKNFTLLQLIVQFTNVDWFYF